jgi:hypothetical protein
VGVASVEVERAAELALVRPSCSPNRAGVALARCVGYGPTRALIERVCRDQPVRRRRGRRGRRGRWRRWRRRRRWWRRRRAIRCRDGYPRGPRFVAASVVCGNADSVRRCANERCNRVGRLRRAERAPTRDVDLVAGNSLVIERAPPSERHTGRRRTNEPKARRLRRTARLVGATLRDVGDACRQHHGCNEQCREDYEGPERALRMSRAVRKARCRQGGSPPVTGSAPQGLIAQVLRRVISKKTGRAARATFLVGTGRRHPNEPCGRMRGELVDDGFEGNLSCLCGFGQDLRFKPHEDPPSIR